MRFYALSNVLLYF